MLNLTKMYKSTCCHTNRSHTLYKSTNKFDICTFCWSFDMPWQGTKNRHKHVMCVYFCSRNLWLEKRIQHDMKNGAVQDLIHLFMSAMFSIPLLKSWEPVWFRILQSLVPGYKCSLLFIEHFTQLKVNDHQMTGILCSNICGWCLLVHSHGASSLGDHSGYINAVTTLIT